MLALSIIFWAVDMETLFFSSTNRKCVPSPQRIVLFEVSFALVPQTSGTIYAMMFNSFNVLEFVHKQRATVIVILPPLIKSQVFINLNHRNTSKGDGQYRIKISNENKTLHESIKL